MREPSARVACSACLCRQGAGFSLIELLLALALGLVVVAGVVQLFVGNSQTYAVLSGQARMQENGRFALEFIARAVRSAGYIGCAPARQNVLRGLTGEWRLIPEVDLTWPVRGFDGDPGGAWTPPLTGLPRSEKIDTNVRFAGMGIDTRLIVPGTDVLVLGGVRAPGARLTEVLSPTGNPVIAAPDGVAPIVPDDVVVIADCAQAAVVRVTDVTVAGDVATLELAIGQVAGLASGPGEPLYRNAATVLSGTGSAPFTLSLAGLSYGDGTTISAVERSFFFIAPGLGADSTGATPRALWQKIGTAAPVELVQGVEDLQVLYGIDGTPNDRTVNVSQYVTAANVTGSTHIVALRASVTASSIDAVNAGAGLQRTFSRTIRVRNALPLS